MSKILDQLKSAGDSKGRCYVRVTPDMTHGPVAMTTVCQWAAEGRVTAQSEVSFNRKRWVRAATIPELGFEWEALSDGNVQGVPFHLKTLPRLVDRGDVPADAQLRHLLTGETLDVPQALNRMAASPRNGGAKGLPSGAGAKGKGTQSLVSHAASLDKQSVTKAPPFRREKRRDRPKIVSQAMAERLGDSGNRLNESQGAVVALESELASVREDLAARDAERDQFRDDLAARRRDLADLECECESVRADLKCSLASAEIGREKLQADKTERKQLVSQIETLKGAVDSLKQQDAILRRERDAKQDRVAELVASLEAAKSEFETASHAHRETLSALSEEASSHEETRTALATAETECETAGAAVAAGQAKIDALQTERETLVTRIAGMEKTQSTSASERSAVDEELERVRQSEAEQAELIRRKSDELDALRGELEARETAVANAQTCLQELEGERDRLAGENQSLGKRLGGSKEQLEEALEAASTLEADLTAAREELAGREKAQASLERDLQARDDKLAALHTKAREHGDKAEALSTHLKSRDETLSELEAALESARSDLVQTGSDLDAALQAQAESAKSLATVESERDALKIRL
ncbi:MAG: hypothetical protein HN700_19230, partial [Verrucomicrobia bacterium]|nr:hypothetical protein [Verrucomicrobiota bacterium]